MPKKSSPQIDTAYTTIRDRIISYALPPGAVISENQLANDLSMSRAPVREAVLLLTADGLIESDSNGKSVVAPIGPSDIVDILRVRRALECEAIRIIADNGWLSDAQLAALAGIHQKLSSSVTAESLIENYRYDDEFHTTIIGFSGNKRIMQVIQRMNLQMQRARWLNIAVPARQHASKAEHDAIYDAIVARDEAAAVRGMEEHLSNSEKTFSQVFTDPNLKQIMSGIYNFINASV